ncbi:hypothetical protein [Microbispora bryophytorum]|uniref:Uncharacterized protein n=1 Tax=Microbispora bryophytorum TaxID=1460882 RepID=A0A8H9L8T4_9ACTN|nr:hypothetical protein [Microbispora bryophytorum]MBD3139542.1 hypothetical protein [Microbispora bryophytorum]TQS02840.1 hypothetical protein FLX07_26240 [Microbispora bryophytorum]GGO02568.1 hypothetical protein GCM10011574_11510 [Microbispora bryophytorum]
MALIFEPADLVGRRRVGKVRTLKNGAYRLRFQRHGETRTHFEVFRTRAAFGERSTGELVIGLFRLSATAP